ncbi:MAG: HAMP domain-containing histidine kinase [Candidatus Sericytochromatia bacterium]|nr:HAMP domain-containing histidine kinase [Candidatus Sericytochromatia bacterium]
MADRDADKRQERDQTDESLRVERIKADASVAVKQGVAEAAEDELVRLARERADAVVQTARDDADHDARPLPQASKAKTEQARDQADAQIVVERSQADSRLEVERTDRVSAHAGALAVEREATDADLVEERAHADTVIAARDQFLATVSHDLRSLLCGLSLNAEQLVKHSPDGAGGDKLRAFAGKSQRMVARMGRLVNDLLDVASIEAGVLALLLEQVDFSQILQDTIDVYEPIAVAKGVTLTIEAAALPQEVALDGGRVLQVLANLISNAIKFTPAEGRVVIRVQVDGHMMHVAVSDTGIGIPEDSLETVFERFRQVSRDARGLGLGLHIAKSIVVAHGGKMWAESQVAAGSTIHFTLPTKAPDA